MFKNKKKKSGCSYHQNLIHKRLDGEITPEENLELDEHLADCPQCFEELNSYALMKDLINDIKENPVEVPAGFFERLAGKLEEVAPARGLSGILAHPFFQAHRNWALAATSFVLVSVLAFGVGTGIVTRMDGQADQTMGQSNSSALILINNGDSMVLGGSDSNPDQHAKAIDELEMAYREAAGQPGGDENDGYIHTTWQDEESDTPIR